MTKCSTIIALSFLLLFSLLQGHSQQSNLLDLSGPYLGQKPPGIIPEVFAPGIISLENHIEMGYSWSPDGKEFYFGRSETSEISSNWAIWTTKEKNGTWSKPEIIQFSGVYRDISPFMTRDGQQLIFYRMNNKEKETRQGSWIVHKKGDTWGEPRYFSDAYCLMTNDFHTFYFTTERNEVTDKDIAQMIWDGKTFSEPVVVKGALNSDDWEAHATLSPCGSYMVFDRIESTFVSFRKKDGSWTRGYNLGGKFHIPYITTDKKFMFFERDGDIWWVDAKIIEEFKPEKLK